MIFQEVVYSISQISETAMAYRNGTVVTLKKINKYGSHHNARPMKELSLNEPDRATLLCLRENNGKEKDLLRNVTVSICLIKK